MIGSYNLAYVAAWLVAVVGVVAGVIAGAATAGHAPSWVTSDVAATCALISTVCVGLAALLPNIQRTPAKREATYLDARAGALPPDLARKHAPPDSAAPPPSAA